MNWRLTLWVLAISSIGLNVACAEFSYSYYSQPRRMGPGHVRSHSIRFSLEHCEIHVTSLNTVYLGSRTEVFPFVPGPLRQAPKNIPEDLKVAILIFPKATGLTFDPFRLIHKGTDGHPVSPSRVGYPNQRIAEGLSSYHGGKWKTCMEQKDAGRPFDRSDGALPITGSACFLITFEVDADPARPYSLAIEGVAKGGEGVLIPLIHFAKDKKSDYAV